MLRVIAVAGRALALAALLACSRQPAPAAEAARAAPAPAVARKEPSHLANPSGLPEDPVAAKRSEAQWREHLEYEEYERQMIFDRQRLGQHRALVKLLASSRARYDRAKSEAALAKVRAEIPKQVAEIRQRMTELDHWGNNSRALPDYDALSTLLAAGYGDAKAAALKGDAGPLEHARADFDQRLHKVDAWLERVEHEEEEEKHEH